MNTYFCTLHFEDKNESIKNYNNSLYDANLILIVPIFKESKSCMYSGWFFYSEFTPILKNFTLSGLIHRSSLVEARSPLEYSDLQIAVKRSQIDKPDYKNTEILILKIQRALFTRVELSRSTKSFQIELTHADWSY